MTILTGQQVSYDDFVGVVYHCSSSSSLLISSLLCRWALHLNICLSTRFSIVSCSLWVSISFGNILGNIASGMPRVFIGDFLDILVLIWLPWIRWLRGCRSLTPRSTVRSSYLLKRPGIRKFPFGNSLRAPRFVGCVFRSFSLDPLCFVNGRVTSCRVWLPLPTNGLGRGKARR